MRIEVDFDECIGSGMCTTAAPDIFELDDAGELIVLIEGELSDDLARDAVRAAEVCPVEAIRVA